MCSKSKLERIKNIYQHKNLLALQKTICIVQLPIEQRSRNNFLADKEITISLQWQKIYDLLEANKIDFFITKFRCHHVMRNFVEKFEKPFVRLKDFKDFKIDEVK